MHNDHCERLLAGARSSSALPREQFGRILDFRLFGNRQGFLRLRDLPIGEIPPTPPDRARLDKPDSRSEHLLLQATALLGEPIGYLQESDGCIVNNFFPQQAHSRAATSDSFDTELELHTENAFHAVLPDYLLLLCLRQDPSAEAITYIASSERILECLSPQQRAFFLSERYNFLCDYGTTGKNQRIDIQRHQTVLYGDPAAPWLRFDPQFMEAFSEHAQQQLDELRQIAWQVAEPVRLQAGDLLIIDNRRTAHARSPFRAHFDGSDRWIQRTFALTRPSAQAGRAGRCQRIFARVSEA